MEGTKQQQTTVTDQQLTDINNSSTNINKSTNKHQKETVSEDTKYSCDCDNR